MGLRSKVTTGVLALVVGPLLLLGALTLSAQHEVITHLTLNHLASVASIQQSRLSAILGQNRERLALITSRTQLRLSLARHLDGDDPAAAAAMTRILNDAASSLPDLLAITVYDLDGRAVASTDRAQMGRPAAFPDLLARGAATAVTDHLALDSAGGLCVYMAGPMILDGRTLGVVLVRAQADNLLSSLFDYAGLGDSGESVLAAHHADDDMMFLAPTRFDPQAAMQRIVAGAGGRGGCIAALAAGASSCVDYRGRRVLAASRDVPGTDWVLVVKIDEAEAYAHLRRATAASLGVLVLLAAVGSGLAVRFGQTLSAPLLELGAAAGAVAGGDYTRRVAVRSRDELGALEQDFNTMAGEIGVARQALEQRVDELNAALAEIKTLRGIIPICASCKKIRDDQGYWAQIEEYLLDHSEAMFSHGLCPDCIRIFDPDSGGGPSARA